MPILPENFSVFVHNPCHVEIWVVLSIQGKLLLGITRYFSNIFIIQYILTNGTPIWRSLPLFHTCYFPCIEEAGISMSSSNRTPFQDITNGKSKIPTYKNSRFNYFRVLLVMFSVILVPSTKTEGEYKCEKYYFRLLQIFSNC